MPSSTCFRTLPSIYASAGSRCGRPIPTPSGRTGSMGALLVLAIAAAVPEANVVLVTWDGVRREEFVDPKLLPRFWSRNAAGGLVMGGPAGPAMEVTNPRLISLPAYQSIFAGALTGCDANDCGRVPRETFPE